MDLAAELRILQRARRQSPVDMRPESPALVLTAPIRRLVQTPLFAGLAMAPMGSAAGRHLRLVP